MDCWYTEHIITTLLNCIYLIRAEVFICVSDIVPGSHNTGWFCYLDMRGQDMETGEVTGLGVEDLEEVDQADEHGNGEKKWQKE